MLRTTMRNAVVLVLVWGCYTAPQTPAATPAPVAPAPPPAQVVSDPLDFLPADPALVVHAEAGALRGGALWTTIETRTTELTASVLDPFKRACGYDPLRQVEHVTFARRADESALVVLRGIPRAQVMGCITRALRMQPNLGTLERNVVVLRREPAQTPVAFAFADDHTLVALAAKDASVDTLRTVLAGGAPLRTNTRFMTLFTREQTGHHAWLFGDGKKEPFSGLATLGIATDTIFGVADGPATVTAHFVLRTAAPADATKLVTTFGPQLSATKSFVEKFEMRADGADVIVDVIATEQQLGATGLL